MEIVGYVASAGSIICWIVTLIQMFQKDTVLKGILGIICGLWAFIWGWMNTAKTGQKGLMIGWTVCIIIGTAANVMAVSGS